MNRSCKQCGAQARPDQRFCEACGANLTQAPNAESEITSRPQTAEVEAGIGQTGDRDFIAGRVSHAVRQRGEHAYVHTTATGVVYTVRTGTTIVTPITSGKEAWLGNNDKTLILDGNAIRLNLWPEDYRQLACLFNADFVGPSGEPSVYCVTTLDRMLIDLFQPRIDRHRADWSDQQLAKVGSGPRKSRLVPLLAKQE